MNVNIRLFHLFFFLSCLYSGFCLSQDGSLLKGTPSNGMSLTWAKIIDDQNGSKVKFPHDEGLKDSNSASEGQNVDPNTLQKRALDLIFHKIIEPKIHKDVKPRPSLLEELIGTFEDHVKKDLKAWGNANQNGDTIPKDLDAYSSNLSPHISVLAPSQDGKITSVVDVEKGKSDDTFVITDESGQTHLISVDEIISSLAQMDEGEINELLLGTSSNLALERSDKVEPEFVDEDHNRNIFIPFSDDIHYNKKGTDENDVILVKSKDGDTRLVTVKDLNLGVQKPQKPKVKAKESTPVINPSINLAVKKNKNKIALNPLESLLKFNIHQNTRSSNGIKKESKNEGSVRSSLKNSQLDHFQNINKKVNKRKENLDAFERIRQSVLLGGSPTLKNDKLFLPSPSASISSVSAPNSPPLKVINTEASIMDFLPTQNTVSIRTNTPPVIQKTGIRTRLSNFFSKLIGRPVKEVNIANQRDEDQFVQIVMPRSDSNTMEQITIPLPRPIHHKGKNIRIPKSTLNKREASSRLRKRHSLFSRKTKTPENPKLATENVGLSTAELILKSANIPESVRKKVLAQVNDKPSFNIPGLETLHSKDQIDRSITVKNKSHKKEIRFPDGFVYEVPPHFENYEPLPEGYEHHHPPHYDPYLGHGTAHDHKGKKHGDVENPLLDINLLADLVFLSKSGDDNDSFSFPKIGDASKFVNVRYNKPY